MFDFTTSRLRLALTAFQRNVMLLACLGVAVMFVLLEVTTAAAEFPPR